MSKIRNLIKKLYFKISPVYRCLRRLEWAIEDLQAHMDRQFERQEMLYWWSEHRKGESMEDTRMRIYLDAPPADGELRKIQLGSNYVLKELKKLCESHEISYWISFGTLLGAARHKGFIPWDDDTDISFLRHDFEKLCEAIKESPVLALKSFYDCKGQWYLYKVVLRGAPELFWTDITIWDFAQPAKGEEEKFWEEIQSCRAELCKEMKRAENSFARSYYSEALEADDAACLACLTAAAMEKIPRPKEGEFIYRSLDSVYLPSEHLLNYKDIFPLTRLEFEGEMYFAPGNYKDYLTVTYDYLNLPLLLSPGHNIPRKDSDKLDRLFRELGK